MALALALNTLILVQFFTLAAASQSSEGSWLDITNASSSEGNVINCTWGILCRKGFQRPPGETGEEFCESGFECLPTASQKIPQEPETAAASETPSSVPSIEPNVTGASNSSKPSSLRGMHIGGGHIGGFGHPGFHPAVHPRPFRPYHPIHPYHPWRPYRPYVRPYWRYPRVWGSAITCPCGVYCRWGYHYAGGLRVCNGVLLCTPCV
eukprot:s2272_g8.t1